MIDLNTIWETTDGRRIALRDLEDTHLANIITWVRDRPKQYPVDLLYVLFDISAKRNLSPEFLLRAPIPYRDKDNHWTVDHRRVG